MLGEVYLALSGAAYFKVEKVISCVLLRPFVEKTQLQGTEVQQEEEGNECLASYCFLLYCSQACWLSMSHGFCEAAGAGMELKEEKLRKPEEGSGETLKLPASS